MDDLVEQILAFVQAVDEAEAESVLATYPALLTPEAHAALETWVPLNDHDPEVQERVLSRLAMLEERGAVGAPEADLGAKEASPDGDDPDLGSDDPERRLAAVERELAHLEPDDDLQRWAGLELERGVCHLELRFADPAVSLRSAATAFRRLLCDDLRERLPELWCAAVNNLALALLWAPGQDRSETVEETIGLLRQAQEVCRRHELEAALTRTHHHLGMAYSERLHGHRKDNLEAAIAAYQEALRRRSRDDEPLAWARTVNDLGTAFLERVAGSRAENLEAAIEAFRQACEVREEVGAETEWASSAQNLATTYCQRIRGDRVANWEQAVDLYERVLEVRTPEIAPLRRAETLTNLGNAYAQRLRGTVGDNLERAIALLNEALSLFPPDDRERRARTQIDLGNVYLDRMHGERQHNLERAIDCHRHALDLLNREDRPTEWATAAENLAHALAARGAPEDRERAVELYHRALDVHRRETHPWTWARLQNSLGVTDDDPHRAADHLRQALEVQTPDLWPDSHRRAARNLGDLHFRRREWSTAAEAYSSALAATRALYDAASTTEARQRQVMEDLDVPANLAYCLARLGRGADAVEVLERSRTRRLAELLDLGRLAMDRLSPAFRRRYRTACEALREKEAAARGLRPSSPQRFLDATRDLQDARRTLREVVEEVARECPELLPTPVSATDVQQSCHRLGRPLLYLLSTVHGSLILEMKPDGDGPSTTFLPGFSSSDLDASLDETTGLLPALEDGGASAVKAALSSCWPTVESLMQSVEARLAALSGGRATLIPVGRLALLPLCAAGERIVWNRLPAARLLPPALDRRERSVPDLRRLVVAATDRERGAITGVVAEARRIAEHHPHGCTLLLGEEATPEAVRTHLPHSEILHFGGHGRFDDRQPLESALLFPGRQRLRVRELLDGDLELGCLQLAVLSGCETGLVEHRHRVDEALGFSAAFLQAGVPTVVAALWQVDDLATTLLINRFHAALMTAGDVAEALDHARRWLRDSTAEELGLAALCEELLTISTDPAEHRALRRRLNRARTQPSSRPYRNPYYWAAFTASGTG